MTYVRLHILTSVVSFINSILLPTGIFMLWFSYHLLQLFMLSFSYLLLTVYHVIIMYTLFICTNTFPFSYTLIGSLSEDSEFARPDWIFYFTDQVLMSSYILRGAGVSLYLVLVFLPSFIPSIILLIPYIYQSLLLFQFLFTWHHVWTSICVIAVIMIYCSRFFCSLFGYLRLSAYMWGIFLAYKRRWRLSCLRSSVF